MGPALPSIFPASSSNVLFMSPNPIFFALARILPIFARDITSLSSEMLPQLLVVTSNSLSVASAPTKSIIPCVPFVVRNLLYFFHGVFTLLLKITSAPSSCAIESLLSSTSITTIFTDGVKILDYCTPN